MLKIRRPLGRLIFNMGIAIPGKTVFLIETAPWFNVHPGPVSLTVFHRNSHSMEILFHSHLDSHIVIATKFCTWHNSQQHNCSKTKFPSNLKIVSETGPAPRSHMASLFNISSGNGLSLNRRETIKWSNIDPVSRRHMVSLGHNQLIWNLIKTISALMPMCMEIQIRTDGNNVEIVYIVHSIFTLHS